MKTELAKKYLKSELRELSANINQEPLSTLRTEYRTIRSSLEVLLDMAVLQFQLSKHKVRPSKEEFLKRCTARLSSSYDFLVQDDQDRQ